MDADENRRDIHRKPSHPRDRPIIVGSGHPEHAEQSATLFGAQAYGRLLRVLSCPRVLTAQTIKKILEKGRKRGKFVPHAINEINRIPDRHAFMNDPAPALSP